MFQTNGYTKWVMGHTIFLHIVCTFKAMWDCRKMNLSLDTSWCWIAQELCGRTEAKLSEQTDYNSDHLYCDNQLNELTQWNLNSCLRPWNQWNDGRELKKKIFLLNFYSIHHETESSRNSLPLAKRVSHHTSPKNKLAHSFSQAQWCVSPEIDEKQETTMQSLCSHVEMNLKSDH